MANEGLKGSFDLVLDEAGNTGRRFQDRQQPVFVIAGWVVPRGARTQAEARADFTPPRNLGLKRGELKGSALMRTVEGQAVANDLLNDLQDIGCLPVLYVAEKRFAIACKAVESFFDPLTNVLLPEGIIRDDLLKQDLARGIYAQDDGTLLYELWEAMDRPDEATLGPLLTRLADGIEADGAPSVALLLRAAKANIGQVIWEMTLDDPLTRTSNGLAAPFFYSLLIDADRLAENVGVTGVNVLFDQASEYEAVFRHAFDKAKNEGFGGYFEEGDRLTSGEVVKLTTQHLDGLAFGNSRAEPLIRAADVLSAVVKAGFSGTGLRRSAWAALGRVIWGHPEELPRTCRFIADESLKLTAFEKAAAAWAPGATLT